jgi:hypothetical protein
MEEIPTPEPYYDDQKMIEVLVDMHLTEALISTQVNLSDSLSKQTEEEYRQLFKRHQITKEGFQKNVEYLSHKMDQFSSFMDRVVDSLNVLNTSLR